jgi:hypothetical protein
VNDTIRESFVKQVDWCDRMGSPLYTAILSHAVADLDAGGVVAEIVSGFEGNAVSGALPLRLMGGVHRLVLTGRAPRLAAQFATVGGSLEESTIREDFLETLHDNVPTAIEALDVPPQTNEIGRSAALLAGLGVAMERSVSRVRLLEIGSSAGLNLNLDRYNYKNDVWEWSGAQDAPTVDFQWTGSTPPLPRDIEIISRQGCDLSPLDATDPTERIRLLSFVWGDQAARFQRMAAAMEMVAGSGITLDRADAADWVAAKLTEQAPAGVVTVLQHSVMWMYLPDETRSSVEAAILDAGGRATDDRPLAHVRFEASPKGYDAAGHRLTVTTWPGGGDRVLATGHAHGSWIAWHE